MRKYLSQTGDPRYKFLEHAVYVGRSRLVTNTTEGVPEASVEYRISSLAAQIKDDWFDISVSWGSVLKGSGRYIFIFPQKYWAYYIAVAVLASFRREPTGQVQSYRIHEYWESVVCSVQCLNKGQVELAYGAINRNQYLPQGFNFSQVPAVTVVNVHCQHCRRGGLNQDQVSYKKLKYIRQ